jgi:uncharacterized protein
MFAPFVLALRNAGVPVSITEHLALMGAMRAGAAEWSLDDFYYLARATLVKDERHFDRFDREFGVYFKALERPEGGGEGVDARELPEEWLRALAERVFTPEEMAKVEALGGFDKLMDTLRERLEEQQEAHRGGSKWIGTGGTSPFGHSGYNPEGVRIGGRSRHRRAVKVWDKREFRDLDDGSGLTGRAMKLALRRLRRFGREGAATHLDLDGTVRATADNAGTLDLRFAPERHNKVKILLLLDVGGSMDDHVRSTQELFDAARSEFKHLEHFYFHNCVYETLWRSMRQRSGSGVPTHEVLRTYGPDWKLIFVGDAAMSPYEITVAGGSVEHWNEEPGAAWMQRLTGHFRRAAWLNPTPEPYWGYTASTALIRRLLEDRMFPLTLDGIDAMARELNR